MKEESVLAWHFVRADKRLGYGASDLTVEPGYIYTEPGPTVLCGHGMHASIRAYDALQYAPGPVLCRVRLWGDIKFGNDKLVAENREVIAVADVTRQLRLFACFCVRNTPICNGKTTWDLLTDKRSQNAVVIAERFADGKATAVELSAARDAAWAAAWDAAWAAARAAAWDAAWAAAWDAARDAARDAAWAAAWDAARDAAWAAAWAAVNKFQVEQFERMMLEAVS